MSSKWKKLDLSRVQYSEDSPSGLLWAQNVYGGKDKKILLYPIGTVAGSIDKRGYWRVMLDYKQFGCHALVWMLANGAIPSCLEVDHTDGDPSNNRLSNLRLVSKVGNMRNRRKLKNNTSGSTGVHKHTVYSRGKPYDYWEAAWIDLQGKYCRKSFSVLKYGFDVAKQMAEQHRSQIIETLNSSGAGYSERHGT